MVGKAQGGGGQVVFSPLKKKGGGRISFSHVEGGTITFGVV